MGMYLPSFYLENKTILDQSTTNCCKGSLGRTQQPHLYWPSLGEKKKEKKSRSTKITLQQPGFKTPQKIHTRSTPRMTGLTTKFHNSPLDGLINTTAKSKKNQRLWQHFQVWINGYSAMTSLNKTKKLQAAFSSKKPKLTFHLVHRCVGPEKRRFAALPHTKIHFDVMVHGRVQTCKALIVLVDSPGARHWL